MGSEIYTVLIQYAELYFLGNSDIIHMQTNRLIPMFAYFKSEHKILLLNILETIKIRW